VRLNYNNTQDNKLIKTAVSIAFYAWLILIFVGCSLPGKEIPKVGLFNNFDKIVHFTFFFVLCILAYLKFGVQNKTIVTILCLAIIYGFALEFYQLYFVKGRSFDVWDGVADSAGAICSLPCVRKRIF
jgi:VanZ family protein